MTVSYHCEIKELPDTPTLSIRTRTAVQESPKTVHKAYGAIVQHLGLEWAFIVPVFTDLFLLKPILFTVPETLNRN
jgi:hypothetical protein